MRAKLPHCLMTPSVRAVEGMKPFFGVQAGDLFIATTGYTGEAGYKLRCPMKSGRFLARAGGSWR